MSKGKMTPGPWKARKAEGFDGPHVPDAWLVEHGREWVVTQAGEADARAISCLPELVEAAQSALDELDTYNMSAPAEDTTHAVAEVLSRILARIEGGGE